MIEIDLKPARLFPWKARQSGDYLYADGMKQEGLFKSHSHKIEGGSAEPLVGAARGSGQEGKFSDVQSGKLRKEDYAVPLLPNSAICLSQQSAVRRYVAIAQPQAGAVT